MHWPKNINFFGSLWSIPNYGHKLFSNRIQALERAARIDAEAWVGGKPGSLPFANEHRFRLSSQAIAHIQHKNTNCL